MQNVIAVIWDFDRTLVDGYMQDPIFEEYGVDAKEFWAEVNALPEKYMREQGVKVNKDTIYLNHFIKCAREGRFRGLNNRKLKDFGKMLKFYPGIPDIFRRTKELLKSDPACEEYNIKVEHYIVSTGFSQVIRGSEVMKYVENIWGCELIDGPTPEGDMVISEIAYTIDNTTKTRALFEINKGINKNDKIDVNSKLSDDQRRISFENMIYIADGPSDVPAFSVVKMKGGATFAIYPKGNISGFKQVEQLRSEDRIDMFAEADYREGTTADMWICEKIREFAERIKAFEKSKSAMASGTPKHLI